MYARLRRVTGRVIDVKYLVQDQVYAQYVIELATSTQDLELNQHAMRLQALMGIDEKIQHVVLQEIPQQEDVIEPEITEEEIYKAQVSHHYIGALRCFRLKILQIILSLTIHLSFMHGWCIIFKSSIEVDGVNCHL